VFDDSQAPWLTGLGVFVEGALQATNSDASTLKIAAASSRERRSEAVGGARIALARVMRALVDEVASGAAACARAQLSPLPSGAAVGPRKHAARRLRAALPPGSRSPKAAGAFSFMLGRLDGMSKNN
jgi:hypothetical protein